jgi:hypothetical protein
LVDALSGAMLGKLVVLAQERREPECLEMMGEQQLGRIVHHDTIDLDQSACRPKGPYVTRIV